MEKVYTILVNHFPEDRGVVMLALYQLNRWLDQHAAPFQMRESIISVALQDGPTIKTLRDWKKLHMPKVPAVMIGRKVALKGSENRRQGILGSEIIDALHDEDSCRRLLLWHRAHCPRHEAIGLMLHSAGHSVGLKHLDKGFMEEHSNFPRVKMPTLGEENTNL